MIIITQKGERLDTALLTKIGVARPFFIVGSAKDDAEHLHKVFANTSGGWVEVADFKCDDPKDSKGRAMAEIRRIEHAIKEGVEQYEVKANDPD